MSKENISSGAFEDISSDTYEWTGAEKNNSVYSMFRFDASRVVPTASENRPYSIYALPLISY